jgi:hypothetical protein
MLKLPHVVADSESPLFPACSSTALAQALAAALAMNAHSVTVTQTTACRRDALASPAVAVPAPREAPHARVVPMLVPNPHILSVPV